MTDFKYVGKTATLYMLQMGVFFVAYFALLNIVFTDGFENMQLIWTMLIYLFPMFITFSIYSTTLPLSLTMGSTRRGFFLAAQGVKTVIAVLNLLLMFVYGLVTFGNIRLGVQDILLLLCFSVAATSMGELMGLVIIRYGRKAMIAYTVTLAIVFGIIGGVSSIGIMTGAVADIVAELSNYFTAISLGLLLFGIILSVGSYKLIKKITVKG